MLRRHFITGENISKPDFIITYYAPEHIPFWCGMKKKNINSVLNYGYPVLDDGKDGFKIPIIFDIVLDKWLDGIGEWGIKIKNTTQMSYYSHIQEGSDDNLESLKVGASDYYADQFNTNLNYANKITNVIFPEGLTHINSSPLYSSDKNTSCLSITLPDSVEYLTGYLFGNYDSLKSITIPSNVKRIDNLCYVCGGNDGWSNSSLEEVILKPVTPPDASHSQSNEPFGTYYEDKVYNNLKIRVYADCIDKYKNDAVWGQYSDLYDTINNVIIYYKNSKHNSSFENTIHNYYDDINRGVYSFTNNEVVNLNSAFFDVSDVYITKECNINLNSSAHRPSTIFIKTSKYYSDNDCIIENKTNSIIVGNNRLSISTMATSIESSAFCNIQTDDRITIPENIINVGSYAFENCIIGDLEINANKDIRFRWTNMHNADFYLMGCCIRKNIYISDCEQYYTTNHELGIYGIINKYNNTLIKAGAKDIISTNVLEIDGAYAYNDSIIEINIPDNVIKISGAFYNCTNLKNITLSNNLTTIGDYSFSGCESLADINLPNSVTSIGNDAFESCSSLTSITIPNSVTSIGGGAFCECTSLTSIVIPDTVTSIGHYAFDDCSSLTSVTIPDSVTSIGIHAFRDCSSLTSTVYNAHCFAYMPTSYSGAYTIPEGIEQIAGGAFSSCSSLTSITIPNSVTSIGEYAFYRCSSLTSITFNGTKAQWEGINLGEDWNYTVPATYVQCTDDQVSLT